MRRVIAVLTLVLAVSPASASDYFKTDYFKTAGQLLDHFNGKDDKGKASDRASDVWQLYATGYVIGISDTYEAWAALSPKKPREVCPPEGVTQGQLAAVVKKWLEAHPERWHEPAALGVLVAFSEAFPCKPGKAQ